MRYIITLLLCFLYIENTSFAQCASCNASSGFNSYYGNNFYVEYASQPQNNILQNRDSDLVQIKDIEIAIQNAKDNNKALLLIFVADWCKYCQPLKSAVQNNIDEINKKFVVCYVDFDSHADLAKKYNIKALPSSVFVKSNGDRRTIRGFGNFQSYKQHLEL
jgi:thioredoxin-like negative regulator of GroEL